MNTQSNAVPEAFDSQRAAPAVTSATRPLYWSVRRELWENRSIYIGPLAVAAVFLFGFLISMIHKRVKVHALLALAPEQQHQALQQPYLFATGLIMGVAMIVQIFYCAEALHSERRDRSILFWKSLPVSDLTTVLSKASIPFVILPLLAFVIVVVTQFFMLLLSSTILLGSGLSVATLWTQLSLSQTLLMLLYHLVTVHVLWYAPIYGWLMLVSGWARRAAFLWAVLPPLAICALEKAVFNTSHFLAMLEYRVNGPQDFVFPAHGGKVGMDWMKHLDLGGFLSTPGLWTGLVVAAAFLVVAVRLRRYRGPI
ncbi:MAG TPA: ABC transporter permease [Candidatus Angelobacter sp.]